MHACVIYKWNPVLDHIRRKALCFQLEALSSAPIEICGMYVGVCVRVSPQLWAYQEGLLAAPRPEPDSDGT